jgi:hypothetical protein
MLFTQNGQIRLDRYWREMLGQDSQRVDIENFQQFYRLGGETSTKSILIITLSILQKEHLIFYYIEV